MIHLDDLRNFVIRPALEWLEMGGQAAEELLLGTALQESNGVYLTQRGGPALGLWQMEPDTHDDIWRNFLRYRSDLAGLVRGLALAHTAHTAIPDAAQMMSNLLYACAMARIHYFRSPRPLPAVGDVKAQAAYWDEVYNCNPAKGHTSQYVANWTSLTRV